MPCFNHFHVSQERCGLFEIFVRGVADVMTLLTNQDFLVPPKPAFLRHKLLKAFFNKVKLGFGATLVQTVHQSHCCKEDDKLSNVKKVKNSVLFFLRMPSVERKHLAHCPGALCCG